MKKIRYNPIVKVVAFLLFAVSGIVFTTAVSLSNQLQYWDFPYTTIEDRKEYSAIGDMERHAYNIQGYYLDENTYAEHHFKEINQTEVHNYRYNFFVEDHMGTKMIDSTYNNEEKRYSHKTTRSLVKQTMVDKTTKETYDSYF